MTAEQHWNEYAACWSTPTEARRERLTQHVTDDIAYRDPLSEVITGVDPLSGYMGGFQEMFPGHRFSIQRVFAHHDRSLAWWEQLDQNGELVADGMSAARHDEDGRLTDIVGFFPITDG